MLKEFLFKSAYRESFDSDRNFGAGSQIFWFRIRSELQSAYHESFDLDRNFRSELKSAYCESLDSDQNFGEGSQIFRFRSEL